VACAKFLRQKHYAYPINDPDLDANAVIAIAVIFAIAGDGPIVARIRQRDIETLVYGVRAIPLDIEAGWNALLKKVPAQFHAILRERMDQFRGTIVKKIMSKIKVKAIITELQDFYACSEMEVDFE
jgi:hypothetical protein